MCSRSSSRTGSRRSSGPSAGPGGRAGARRHVRLRLPVQDGQLHAEPARPHGGRPLRLAAAARRGRQVLQKEDIVPDRADRRLFKLAPYLVVGDRAARLRRRARSGPTRSSPTSTSASSSCWPCRRSRSSASSSPAGRRPTSTRCIGGLRAAGQLIAYELPLVLAVVGVVIQAGTLNLQGIVARPGRRRDLRLGRHRQPVHPHPVRRARASSSSPCRPS